MTLLELLNNRYSIAKSFSKNFHADVKKFLEDYDPGEGYQPILNKKTAVQDKHLAVNKLDIKIPYIFATHESMIAALFEKMPEIIISGRSGENTEKAEILKALYLYLEDKLDLDEFLANSAWWLLLVGFVMAKIDYKIEVEEYVPQLDSEGMPMLDEMGEEVTIPKYAYHDPVVSVENLLKVHFAPDSQFTISGDKVPYYIVEKLVECDEIEETYGIEVEPDQKIEVDGYEDSEKSESDLDRCCVLHYYGKIPKKYAPYLEEFGLTWAYKTNYKIYHTKSKILYADVASEKACKFARMYYKLNTFFGFGLAKTLKPFQDDMSVRRGQQIRYADLFAYPWLLVPSGTTVSQKEIMDRHKRTPLVVGGEKEPSYLVPPNMPAIVTQADEASRSDAQFVSGTLDLSKGAQQTNTVKTATGQQLFAQSQDKRLQKVRKSLAKYYREVVISLFKMVRENWDGEKEISYYDEDEQYQEKIISAEDLADIDFDTDVDFSLDSVSVNQDIMSQRWISLLETSANVPNADLDKIYEKVLRESFKISNPETYVKPVEEQSPPEGGETPPPAENPEEIPQEESMGSQLAPTGNYGGL
jgi:hypothetical protein